jgi:hypothetical protein
VKQSHQNLNSEVADLKSKFENEIVKTMQLGNDVENLKETQNSSSTKHKNC